MRVCKIQQTETGLEEIMKDFLRVKKAQQPSARTMKDYERYLNDFLSFSNNSIEEKTLNQDILDFFAQIPLTSPARYNHPYQYLSSFFNWAVAQDLIRRNPIVSQGLKKKRDDGNIKPASIDDIKVLLNSFDRSVYTGLRNYVITLVLLDTGIRTSEIVQLKNEDFDMTAKSIMIKKTIAKTRRNRVAYLSNSTAAALTKFMRIKPKEWENWLFPSREGIQLTSHNMTKEFNKQCKKADVKFTPYQLRHTFATYFIQNGGDVFTLQELMGHSDIKMTKRYTDINDKQKREAHAVYSPINALSGRGRLVSI